ncbi:MAG: Tim44/TimA family putative adaptor protein [Allosphingosinicella sp.]|uniref:Tim44/TimA family putative adaptor protein n=1 Tax=Allosphingosinicella sp. TaxID=2823234 RepID=UPI003961F9B4
MTVEIVLLAMVALFVGLRLYAVLGQRTGHEQQPITPPQPAVKPEAAVPVTDPQPVTEPSSITMDKSTAAALRSLIAADPSFDTARFLDGAQAAYRMILEAFWKGDRDTLAELVGDDVRAAFDEAITERDAAGHRLDNRLIAIERAAIESASVDNRTATVEVRFDAYVAAVTRDAEGEVVAGSLTDAVATHDIWTFRRDLKSDDPNWVLVETDEAGE